MPDTVGDGGPRRWPDGVELTLRRRVVDMILGKLVQVCEGKPASSSTSHELNRTANSLELKIFSEANSEEDYINRVAHKLFIMERNWQHVLHDASGPSQNVKMGCHMQPVNRVQAIHCSNSPITTMIQVSSMMNSHERELSHMRASIGSVQQVNWNEEMPQQQNDAAAASNGSKTNSSMPSSLLQMEASDFHTEHGGGEKPLAKKPIDRLIIALHSSSSAALKSSANSICSIISMDDLVAHVDFDAFRHWIFSSNLGGSQPSMKMKRLFEITTPDSELQLLTDTWEVEANGEPGAKWLKAQNARCAVLDKIESTNSMLMDTVTSIADENSTDRIASTIGGMLIVLSYTAMSLGPDLKSLFAASGMLPIVMRTKLLVPGDYPRSSPVLVTDQMGEQQRNMFSDISGSADVAFRNMLRTIPEPRSIREMVRVWDACVRWAVTEFAQQFGGGMFGSGWESSGGA